MTSCLSPSLQKVVASQMKNMRSGPGSNQVLRLHSLGAIKALLLLRFHLSNQIRSIDIMNQKGFMRWIKESVSPPSQTF